MKWFKSLRRFCYACGDRFSLREYDLITDSNENNKLDVPDSLIDCGLVCYNCKRYRI